MVHTHDELLVLHCDLALVRVAMKQCSNKYFFVGWLVVQLLLQLVVVLCDVLRRSAFSNAVHTAALHELTALLDELGSKQQWRSTLTI